MDTRPHQDDADWKSFRANGGMNPAFVAKARENAKTREARHVAELLERQRLDATIKARRLLADRSVPVWVRKMVLEAAQTSGVPALSLLIDCRTWAVVKARNALLYQIKATKPHLSSPQIARWFGKDHTSILHAIACHQRDSGAPALVGYDVEAVKARNREMARRQREVRQ